MTIAIILAVLASIAITIFLCVKVIPAKYDGTFDKKPLQKIHNYFNFKKLYLESILKTMFTFLTIVCIVFGVFTATIGNILQVFEGIADAIKYEYLERYLEYMGDQIFSTVIATFFGGLAIAVIGPIVLRLVYEGLMMFILLVKNTIEINNKLKKNEIQE